MNVHTEMADAQHAAEQAIAQTSETLARDDESIEAGYEVSGERAVAESNLAIARAVLAVNVTLRWLGRA